MAAQRRLIGVIVSALVLLASVPGFIAPASAAPWTAGPAVYGVAVTNDVPITMSDGRVLRSAIHRPTDLSTGQPADGPFPVLLSETPYGKSFSNPIPPYLVQRGYIGVAVDVAGTGGSEGKSQLFGATESADSVEVINWAAALPGSTGKVGMIGISYLAITQLFAAAAVGPGSPLKAIFPVAGSADPYRDLFTSGGVVNLESPLGLLAGYGVDRSLTPLLERMTDPIDAVRLMLEHAAQMYPFELTTALQSALNGERRYDGPYWRERSPDTVLADIVANDVAVYLVGGQYDVFQRGEPLLYSALQNIAAGRPAFAPMVPGQPVSSKYHLLFGPWDHGNQGAGLDLNALQLQWFDHWLKGVDTGITDTTTPLHVIEPGGARYDARNYPVETTSPQRYYLGSAGSLGTSPATGGGGDVLLSSGMSNPCTRSTQQFAAGLMPPSICGATEPAPLPAPLQIHYTSPPLPNGLTLAGPIGVALHATSTSRETLFAVSVQDVAPDGTVVHLSGGAQLGSLRAVDTSRSWTAPNGGYLLPYHPLTKESRQPVRPLVMTRYDIEIRPVFASLAPRHRLRVLIGTGDFPHLTPTPLEIHNMAGLYTVHRNATAQSWIDLPVVA